jgi:hypothetical protein
MQKCLYSTDVYMQALDAFVRAVSDGKLRRSLLAMYEWTSGRGVCFIPNEVAHAQHLGQVVTFHATCMTSSCCWYWELPDGQRIYHFDRDSSARIRNVHGGTCPECGNTHIVGGLRPHGGT